MRTDHQFLGPFSLALSPYHAPAALRGGPYLICRISPDGGQGCEPHLRDKKRGAGSQEYPARDPHPGGLAPAQDQDAIVPGAHIPPCVPPLPPPNPQHPIPSFPLPFCTRSLQTPGPVGSQAGRPVMSYTHLIQPKSTKKKIHQEQRGQPFTHWSELKVFSCARGHQSGGQRW